MSGNGASSASGNGTEPGYRREPRIFKLVFSDPEMAGLVVRARSVSLGTLRHVQRLPNDADGLDEMVTTFAAALVSWNLQDDEGEPVPATLEGLDTQDADFTMRIFKAWMSAINGEVPGPLERRSNGGVPSLEGSMPMEALSASP